MNEVFETETFSEVLASCEKTEQEWIEKMKEQLVENLRAGQPLKYEWFREKKFGNKRLFYIINEQKKKVLLIAFGSKKEQQGIINHILMNKETYQNTLT